MAFRTNFIDVLKYKYAEFNGRASRSEYWYFTLFKWISMIVLLTVSGIAGDTIGGAVFGIFGLALMVPSLAMSVRRLHDTGKSGWYLLLGIIPLIGPLILFIFYIMESDPGPNEYGHNPYEIANDITDHLI